MAANLTTQATTAPQAAASIWRLAVKRVSPIVRLNACRTGCPIYFIHPISGDVGGLKELANQLADHPALGIQVPREQMTEMFGSTIESMASAYVEMITALQPEGRFCLAGWSAGAIIALEMAQMFRLCARPVEVLIALDGAPCNTGAGLPAYHPLYVLKLLWNLPRWVADDCKQDWSFRGIWGRIESKLAFKFGIGIAPAKRLDSTQTIDGACVESVISSPGWSGEQKAFIHAMYRAMIKYVPRPYEGDVLVFETKTQPLYHLRQIGAVWRALAPGSKVISIKGNHSELVGAKAAGVIASSVSRHLADRPNERDEATASEAQSDNLARRSLRIFNMGEARDAV